MLLTFFPSLPLEIQIPLHFIITWLTVIYLSSWLSGWQTLAWKYHARRKITGETFHMQSAAMGLSSYFNQTMYHSCLTIIVNNDGIYVVPMLIFRLGHAPLFIPWNHLHVSEWKILWMKHIVLTIYNDKCTKFLISEDILKYKPETPEHNPVPHKRRK